MRTIILLFLLLNFLNLPAQISFEGTVYSNGYKRAAAQELTETNTHEFIFCGRTEDHGGFTGYKFVEKLDQYGIPIWTKNDSVYTGASIGAIDLMNNGSYLISGSGDNYIQGQQLFFVYLINMDTAGNVLWSKNIGGDSMSVFYNDVICNLAGGIVVAGQVDTSTLSYSAFYEFDSAGNLILEKQFPYSYTFKKIIQVPDSSYYIIGEPGGYVTVFHLDKNANIISSYQVTDSLITGATVGDFKFKNGILYSCIGGYDTLGSVAQYFHEYNITNGNIRQYPSNETVCNFYPLDNNEKLILSLCPNANSNGFNPAPPVNTYFEKVDSNMTPIWTYCIHPQYGILSIEYKKSSDNGCLLASPIDTFFQDQYQSMYYLKLDSNGILLNSNDVSNEITFSLFPNPFQDVIRYESTLSINSISIYDVTGHLVCFKRDDLNGIIKTNLESGIYFLFVDTDKGRLMRKIVRD